MNRTLEVLEGNVDLLINRCTALVSERDSLQAAVDGLETSVRDLESRLVAVQQQATLLEGRLGVETAQRKQASAALQQLIDRLAAGADRPEGGPVGPASDAVSERMPRQAEEVRDESMEAVVPTGSADPVVLSAAARPAPMRGDDPQTGGEGLRASFENAIRRLQGISVNREHVALAAGSRGRIF